MGSLLLLFFIAEPRFGVSYFFIIKPLIIQAILNLIEETFLLTNIFLPFRSKTNRPSKFQPL